MASIVSAAAEKKKRAWQSPYSLHILCHSGARHRAESKETTADRVHKEITEQIIAAGRHGYVMLCVVMCVMLCVVPVRCGAGVVLCGAGVVLVWCWCGASVVLVWCWCGAGAVLVWCSCGAGVVLVWCWCGASVVLVWC